MNTNKKILVIDDHHLFAEGLAMILESCDHRFEVDTSNNAQDFLTDTNRLTNYDLVLIDLHMPRLSGFSFLSAARAQSLNIVIAVISGSDKKIEIERAISLGAQGFIPKESSREEFIDASSQLLQGRRYLPLAWDGEIDWKNSVDEEMPDPEALTIRQHQVLELMRDGLQNKQIALVLGIKPSSVKGHVERLFTKFSVNNRTSCVQIAQEQNLI